MRRITIVGGGQAGLQLGISLRQKDLDVCIVSDRTPDEIRNGKVMSSQGMFDDALQSERDLGINFWEHQCPNMEGMGLNLGAQDGCGLALHWAHRFDKPAQSVDQRLKFPGWMKHFEEIGGKLVIHKAGIADLEEYSRESDLVIVASGKSDIASVFERDAARSPFDKPKRALGMVYVTGIVPVEPFSRVSVNLIPGVGECFVIPALTIGGACDILLFEGLLGGPMDCWHDLQTADDWLTRAGDILRRFAPWEAERCRNMASTDQNGTLAGSFTPTVRKPVGQLPSGSLVLGMADAVVLNDPIAGQGSNHAAKSARIYLNSIVENADKPFDRSWMQRTFDRCWDDAQWATSFTNAFLLPPPPHGLPSRLLFSWPEAQPFARPRGTVDVSRATGALCRLARLEMSTAEDGSPVPVFVTANHQAAEILTDFAREMQSQERKAGGLMIGVLGKARGYALRLAVVLEFLPWAWFGNRPEPTEISGNAMRRAVKLMRDYFLPMASRVLGDAAITQQQRDARTLATWIAAERPDRINLRGLSRGETAGDGDARTSGTETTGVRC